jgi:hypothetical protein
MCTAWPLVLVATRLEKWRRPPSSTRFWLGGRFLAISQLWELSVNTKRGWENFWRFFKDERPQPCEQRTVPKCSHVCKLRSWFRKTKNLFRSKCIYIHGKNLAQRIFPNVNHTNILPLITDLREKVATSSLRTVALVKLFWKLSNSEVALTKVAWRDEQ